MADEKGTANNLYDALRSFDISKAEIKSALAAGYTELEHFKQQIRNRGEDTMRMLMTTGEHGIVLAGRPYHLDPQVNHGISQLMTAEGFHVLTEDSIAHLGDVKACGSSISGSTIHGSMQLHESQPRRHSWNSFNSIRLDVGSMQSIPTKSKRL